MAHTCGFCGCNVRINTAPNIDGGIDSLAGREDNKLARRINPGYSHDFKSWKRATKARKQWGRHPHRLG